MSTLNVATLASPDAVTNLTVRTGNTSAASIVVSSAALLITVTGEIRATTDITAYYSSDESLKTNVFPIKNAIIKLKQINGVEFDWTDEYINQHGGEDGYFVRKHDIGVIAQEVEKVLPEIVATRNNGIKAVKYEKIVALLIEAVKELSDRVEKLESL